MKIPNKKNFTSKNSAPSFKKKETKTFKPKNSKQSVESERPKFKKNTASSTSREKREPIKFGPRADSREKRVPNKFGPRAESGEKKVLNFPPRKDAKAFGERKFNEKSFSNYKTFTPKKFVKSKPVSEGVRLNKYIANAGVSSRREADEHIKTGLVTVDGKVITEMGFIVMPNHEVKFDGNRITPEKQTYVLLNKPKGFISTSNDEKARKTVLDLVNNATPYRIYPVGRLDRQTTGVLLLTNDGELTKKLTHPSSNIKKIYHVVLDKKLTNADFESIKAGVRLFEGVVPVDSISFIEGAPRNEVGMEIHIGWNRVIRRLFTKLGYEVEKLDRVSFGGLTKKNLKRGDWRILDQKEVSFLKML